MTETKQQPLLASELPSRGQPLDGGIFVGRYFLGAEQRALILLPDELNGAYGEYGQDIAGASSYSDGEANTRAMAEAGSAIAIQALGLGAFIPSCLEGHLLMAAKTEGLVTDLREDRYHWLSTQFSAYYAYDMDFELGWQHDDVKGNERPVRLVRSRLIQ